MADTRVVVVGGGFGGLYAAAYLARAQLDGGDLEVLLMDRKNFFTFTPLLAEVAAGTLGREHVTYSYRVLSARRGFRYMRAEIHGVDPERRVVRTEGAEISYDYLIVAVGASPSYYGNEEIRRNSLPFVTVEDALGIRAGLIRRLEQAGRIQDEEKRSRCLSFVVAGGGPAGVEVASELQRLGSRVLRPYFPDTPEPRVVLVTASDQILEGYDDDLVAEGLEVLRKRGMEILLDTTVKGRDSGRIQVSGPDGDREIEAETLIWTAGTSPPGWLHDLDLPVEPEGIRVDPCLRVEGHDRIYAVGDASHLVNERTGRPFPAVAPIAISQGVRAAGNIEAALHDRSAEPYHAQRAGKIVSLGGGVALVDVLGFRVTGAPAWFLYRSAYIGKLVGWKNKLRVLASLLLNRLFEPDITFPEELPG